MQVNPPSSGQKICSRERHPSKILDGFLIIASNKGIASSSFLLLVVVHLLLVAMHLFLI